MQRRIRLLLRRHGRTVETAAANPTVEARKAAVAKPEAEKR